MAEPAQLAIRRDFPRPGADEIAPFRNVPTGWVVDAQGRRGALPHWIKPLSRQTRFVGTALTVRTRPVDNLAPLRGAQVCQTRPWHTDGHRGSARGASLAQHDAAIIKFNRRLKRLQKGS
jgi:hypothetical protein